MKLFDLSKLPAKDANHDRERSCLVQEREADHFDGSRSAEESILRVDCPSGGDDGPLLHGDREVKQHASPASIEFPEPGIEAIEGAQLTMADDWKIRALIVEHLTMMEGLVSVDHKYHHAGVVRGLLWALTGEDCGESIMRNVGRLLEFAGIPFDRDGEAVLISDEWLVEHGLEPGSE